MILWTCLPWKLLVKYLYGDSRTNYHYRVFNLTYFHESVTDMSESEESGYQQNANNQQQLPVLLNLGLLIQPFMWNVWPKC